MFRSIAPIRLLLRVLFGPVLVMGLLFTTGCWDEFSNDTPLSDAPSSNKAVEPTEEPAIEAPPLSTPEETTLPVESGRYSDLETTAEEAPEKLLPWETDSSAADPSPEAERLFGGSDEPLDEPLDEADAPEVVEKTEETETDDFESFLTEAYADLNEKPIEKLVEEPAEEVEDDPPQARVVEERIADLPLPEVIAPPPTEPVKEELPSADSPIEEDSLDSLFADIEETEPAAIDPAPSRYAEEPSPLLPKEPVMSEPIVTEPVESLGSKIKPLPAVSVLPSNTRHLAWLLGGKLSLAQLAGAGGATSDEVAGWTEETRRLAGQLKVAAPPSADDRASAVERVGRLLVSATEMGRTLAEAYGPDHAALVEMALKTNALLVLHEERSDLTPTIARAVATAANRADLPGYVWRDAIKVLERQPTVDEVYDAVIKLHADVEAHLR